MDLFITIVIIWLGASLVIIRWNLIDRLYMEVKTNPAINNLIPVLGDVFYMIGGGIVTAIFIGMAMPSVPYDVKTLIYGIMMIAYGAYTHEKIV
jgi:hypothetical protein